MYIFFSFYFIFLLSFSIRSIVHSLSFTPINSLRVPFFLIFFLFCLKISRVSFPKPPKLLLIQPTKLPPQNTSKSSPWIFRHTWFRQNSAHIFIISKPLFPNIFPNKNLIAPLQGGIHKISVSLVRHNKKICLLVARHLWRDYSRQFSVDTDYKKSETLSISPIVGINNFHKKPGLIPPAPKISILPT